MTRKPKPPPPHVIVVGGGLAGLASAAGLVGRGLQLTLLESRPRLGGRASSFTDPASGELVDNCQHVSMRCCTNLADFCRRVGIDSMMRRDTEMTFLSPEGRVSKFRAGLAPLRSTWPEACCARACLLSAKSCESLAGWRL